MLKAEDLLNMLKEAEEVDNRPAARKLVDTVKDVGGKAVGLGAGAAISLTQLGTPTTPKQIDPTQ